MDDLYSDDIHARKTIRYIYHRIAEYGLNVKEEIYGPKFGNWVNGKKFKESKYDYIVVFSPWRTLQIFDRVPEGQISWIGPWSKT